MLIILILIYIYLLLFISSFFGTIFSGDISIGFIFKSSAPHLWNSGALGISTFGSISIFVLLLIVLYLSLYHYIVLDKLTIKI